MVHRTISFACAKRGSLLRAVDSGARIGRVFGPILLLWFLVIAGLGGTQIVRHPEILAAFNPIRGAAFLWHGGVYETLLILGALMLVVTGGEAMYADMGHFGARPIRTSWFAVVYPALLLNYLGHRYFSFRRSAAGAHSADGHDETSRT